MKAFLAANPRAGGMGGGGDLPRLVAHLEKMGIEVQPLLLPSPAAAVEVVKEALRDASPDDTCLVIVGGDGTINALLPALVNNPVPVVVLPRGTFNVLARDLGIPLRWEEAGALALAVGPDGWTSAWRTGGCSRIWWG